MNDQEAKKLRDELRAKTVGSACIFKSRIKEYNGVEVEIREPSVETWGLILEKARGSKGETIKFSEYLLWTVIYCTFVPGTNLLLFEDTDYDGLKTKPKDSFVSEFNEIAQQLMELDTGVATKNSEETGDAS